MLDKEIRLQALREFTDCFYPVWSWELDRFFNVIQSDCTHESLIRSVFKKHTGQTPSDYRREHSLV